jgi:hypothetical protein
MNASFYTSVYVDSDEDLATDTECLRCILDVSDIEIELNIDFDWEHGDPGSYDNPPEVASADHTNIEVTNIDFFAGDSFVEESIKILITKQQKEAMKILAERIISRDWRAKYEDEAFKSLPSPDDYY